MKVKLSDAFELQMGKTPDRSDSSCWSGAHKWVSIADLSKADKYIIDTKETISDTGVAKSGIKVVPKGTVIMSFKLSIGKTAITTEDLYTNEAIMAFIDKGIYEIDTNYIYHLFASKDWNEGTNKAVLGLTLNKATLSQVEIEIPSIAEQKQVVEVLDKVDELISLRKKQLQKLDDLVKSRFVEMFGDTKSNPFGFEKRPLRETCTVITGNTPSRSVPEYYGDSIEWIKTDNIVVGQLNPSQAVEYLSDEGVKVGRTVEKDAILMACIAGSVASIGRMCITDRKVAFNQQINAVVPKDYDSLFLHAMLQLSKEYLVEEINMALKGILSKSKLESKEFIVPPMSQQKVFAAFVTRVDNSKLTVQQGLDKLELLKQSLMQKYFG